MLRARRAAQSRAIGPRAPAPRHTPPGKLPPPPASVRSRLAGAALRSPAAARLLQILEEIRAWVEHHDVALVLECRLVRLQTAIERIELGVLPVGAGVDRGSPGVAFALGLLRLLVGVSENDLALAIGVGTDLLRLRAALRPELVGDALALGFHPLVDLGEHFIRPLDAAQTHVDDFDADRPRGGVGFVSRF